MNEHALAAITAIASIPDRDSLDAVAEALNDRHRALQSVEKFAFTQGDRVSFTSKGRTFTGTVIGRLKVNIKVKVDNGGEWRVAPSLLTKVT